MVKLSRTPSADLKRFRVAIEDCTIYTVDILAPDRLHAKALAECIDPEYLRHADGRWEATEAWEVSADEFSPPDLPASSWIAPPATDR